MIYIPRSNQNMDMAAHATQTLIADTDFSAILELAAMVVAGTLIATMASVACTNNVGTATLALMTATVNQENAVDMPAVIMNVEPILIALVIMFASLTVALSGHHTNYN